MPQLNLDYIDAEILIVALAEYSSPDPDMIERAERMYAQLDVLLDDRDKIKRLMDALQELYDFGSVHSAGKYSERSRLAFANAGKLLRELREHHE